MTDDLDINDPNPLRMVEAMLFAATEPVEEAALALRLPEGTDMGALLEELRQLYRHRGIHLVRTNGRWAFRTAPDLAEFLRVETETPRKLSRAAIETLAIIAYHQPVTRAEIEEIRGVAVSRGTLDILFEANWVQPKGRRRTPGRPVTWVTTEAFLQHFGLESMTDLPGLDDLKAAGLLDRRPSGYGVIGGDGGQMSLLPESIEQSAEDEAMDMEADGAEVDDF